MRNSPQEFVNDESGATLVEYGVALVVAILVGGTGLSLVSDATVANMDGAKEVVETPYADS